MYFKGEGWRGGEVERWRERLREVERDGERDGEKDTHTHTHTRLHANEVCMCCCGAAWQV